ncbi:MAG: class C beta-lactamase-related serine hydrolase [Chloroflexota bacterium]|nr:MAG: class C beta-lactamase-related serine hydrolase [Chloroflexota bacterium]
MNKRKVWFWVIGVAVFLIGGLTVGWFGMSGRLPWQGGDLYEDPQGRFTMEVDPSWEQVETDGRYSQFKVTDPPLNMYLLVLEASTVDDAFSQAFEIVGFDPGLLTGGDVANIGVWQAYTKADSAGLSYGLAGQIVGENAYVLVVKADKPGVTAESPAVNRALGSFKVTGNEENVIESYADLEAMVQQHVDRLAGSASVAVVHNDEIVYTYVYGEANPIEGIPADTQTIYRYGSMTKVVTASALMQLVEQGLVDLDAWPGIYVPEFPERWNVTVRQLLTHAACMPDEERLVTGLIAKRGESLAPLEEIFTNYVKDDLDLACEPGKVSNYSNAHFLALARIIEEVSGEPYETYVVDHILTPLAMQSTHFQLVEASERYAKGQWPAAQTDALVAQLNKYRGPGQEYLVLQRGESFSTLDDFRILPPWGGLLGTPGDLTHFLQMFLSNGRYGDIQILKPETVADMQEMQKSTNGSPLGMGLSWWIGEDDFGTFYYHDGGGATIETHLRYYPDLDLGVVVMGSVNGYQSDTIAEGLVSAWMQEK